MTDQDILDSAIKLYTRKKNGWFITGYKCPYCEKHYHTLRKEMYNHIRKCDGPKIKRSLED